MNTRRLRRSSVFALLLMGYALLAAAPPVGATPSSLQLPSLGEASAGLLSPSDERELGQKLLRRYRGGLPLARDPYFEDYLRRLLSRIARSSDLTDKRLDLLVLDSPQLNAFAAPGGIVGVNTGAFITAQTEEQLASIIAHELAHLSQRHFARSLQQQEQVGKLSLAAMLATLLAAAAAGGDVAYAGLPAVQALAADASLRFSRQMEQEADRLGMETMVRAGLDPNAMTEMFEQMLKATRYRSKVPEFLLTHPVTESRIADAAARARRYPRTASGLAEEYQLLRARAMLHHAGSPQLAVRTFNAELKGHGMPEAAARYGLALALIKSGQLTQAESELKKLAGLGLPKDFLATAQADLAEAKEDYDSAIKVLRAALAGSPEHHPLNVRLAEILMAAGRYDECEAVLLAHSQREPDNRYVWYLLAEVHGLAGHIFDVHKARAEYFILTGHYDKAEIQLRNALRMVDAGDRAGRARLEQRLADVRDYKENDL